MIKEIQNTNENPTILLDFNKNLDNLIPAIIQDANTQKVLMLGYMNEESWQKTLNDKVVTFFSRTKQRLWTKGETSGNFLHLVSYAIDCDNDTILLQVNPVGEVCHTGADTCFQEKNSPKEATDFPFLRNLENIIKNYQKNPKENSYTSSLFAKGINKIAQKVGEEAVEVIIEAKDQKQELFLGECADLLYHYIVLLIAKNHDLDDVINVLKERHK